MLTLVPQTTLEASKDGLAPQSKRNTNSFSQLVKPKQPTGCKTSILHDPTLLT